MDYSADDIEHGILRGNRPTAGSLSVLVGHPEWSQGYFKKTDPRLKQVGHFMLLGAMTTASRLGHIQR